MAREYRNVKKTKRAVRAAFVELIREKQSLEKITVAELAERADIAKSTFYYHYGDVYQVAEEFEGELVDALNQTLNEFHGDMKPDFLSYVGKIIEFLKAHEDEYRVLCNCVDILYFLSRLKAILIKRITEETENMFPHEIEPVRLVKAHFIVNACVDTVMDYFRGQLDVPLEQVQGIIGEMLQELYEE